MKKIIKVFLACLLCLSLSACGSSEPIEEAALDKLEAAIQNVENMKAANYAVVVNSKSGEDTSDISLSGAYNVKEAMQFSMKAGMNTVTDGEEINYDNFISIVCDGKDMYLNMMNLMKTKTSMEDSEDTFADFDTEAFKMDREELKKYLTKAKVNGNDIQLVFNTEKLMEVYNESMNDMDEETEASLSMLTGLYEDMNITKLDGTITIKDDMFADIEFNIVSSMTVEGETSSSDAVLRASFTDINSDVKIELPADADSYVEEDPSLYE